MRHAWHLLAAIVIMPLLACAPADYLLFSITAGVSIAALNVSLLVNSVGFYQVSKLLIIPFVCCVEALWQKRPVTLPVLGAILLVLFGVGIVCVGTASVGTPLYPFTLSVVFLRL
jgi:solute carrier family 35 protein E3